MAEEEKEAGSVEGDGSAGEIEVWSPKTEWIPEAGMADMLQVWAEEGLVAKFKEIVGALVMCITTKQHLPSLKLLVELANRVKTGKEVPAVVYQSLAAVLWEEIPEAEEDE